MNTVRQPFLWFASAIIVHMLSHAYLLVYFYKPIDMVGE